MTVLAISMGDVRVSYNKPLAVSQTIRKGDPVTIAAGRISKGAIGTALIEGFADHDLTSTATYNANTRLIYDKATDQKFSGLLVTTYALPTDTSLEGTDAGFIIEGGLFKIDPAATVKQITIVKVPEPFVDRKVHFIVKAAFRQGVI